MLGSMLTSVGINTPGFAQTFAMRSTTMAQRKAAVANQAKPKTQVKASYAGVSPNSAGLSALTTMAAKSQPSSNPAP